MHDSVMPSHGDANPLIPIIEMEDRGIQAVLGRDLHAFLQIKTPYKDWFPRMVEYGFNEGQDYALKNEHSASPAGMPSRPRLNHIVSLDMAKEISMIQRTPRGKQARQYFIECERRYRTGEMSELDEARIVHRALQITYQKQQELEAWKQENAPKAHYYDTFVADEDLIQFRSLANQLGVKEKQLRELLIARKWIYRITGKRWSNTKHTIVAVNQYRAYAEKKHLFRLVPCHEAPRVNGEVQQSLKLTPHGVEAVTRLFEKVNNSRLEEGTGK